MTQSKDNDDTITINLDDTYGTTTSYIDTVDDITFTHGDAFTVTDLSDTIDVSSITLTKPFWEYESTLIDKDEIERMCKEYPALEKTWRNFKSVYDMVKQDYKGKKQAGELDDDIPF